MISYLPFSGILLGSAVVALLAALQLADLFRTGDEFGLVMLWLVAFASVSLAAFVMAYGRARRPVVLTVTAWALALLAVVPLVWTSPATIIASQGTNPFTVGEDQTAIVIELVAPALLAVLVQWGLVRWRWMRAFGTDVLSPWPWVTTAIAGLMILNPVGLDFLRGALTPGGGNLLWELSATISGVALGTLLVMAWVECYIRDRMLRRRAAGRVGPVALSQRASA